MKRASSRKRPLGGRKESPVVGSGGTRGALTRWEGEDAGLERQDRHRGTCWGWEEARCSGQQGQWGPERYHLRYGGEGPPQLVPLLGSRLSPGT